MNISLVCQTGFTEVHLIVDNSGQKEISFGINNKISRTRGKVLTDSLNILATNKYVSFKDLAFVDYICIRYQCILHSVAKIESKVPTTTSFESFNLNRQLLDAVVD